MSKWKIEYNKEFIETPLSFWVHKEMDDIAWSYSENFEPPLPKAIPCKGFPMLIIDAFGTELKFASIEEIEHFVSVIDQKNMPTSTELSEQRGSSLGPNSHWLSRLPSSLKSWSKREKLKSIIEKAIVDFKKVSLPVS